MILAKPRHKTDIIDCRPLQRVHCEAGPDDVSASRRDTRVVYRRARQDLVFEERVLFTLHNTITTSKSIFTRQNLVQNDPQRPNIHPSAPVVFLLDDLRRHVGWRPAELLGHLTGRTSKTEVYQLDSSFFVYQNVSELQVSVRDAFIVEVSNCFENLDEYVLSLDVHYLPLLVSSAVLRKSQWAPVFEDVVYLLSD